MTTKNVAIFASGAGTNAINCIQYFDKSELIKICLIVCNNPQAGIVDYCKTAKFELALINKTTLNNEIEMIQLLNNHEIDCIVLAGFLWLIPLYLVTKFENKMINLHPSLLPKYGGRGMYGRAVHEAVFEAKETKTGITIHYVTAEFDKGALLIQHETNIEHGDTVTIIEEKIKMLEKEYLPAALLLAFG